MFLTHFAFVDCVNSDSCYCDPEVAIQSCHVFFCATTVVFSAFPMMFVLPSVVFGRFPLCLSIHSVSVSFDR